MALKLKIGASIDAPVRLLVRDGARDVVFPFVLVLRRLSQDEALALVGRLQTLAEDKHAPHDAMPAHTRDLLADIVTDWRDQRLVLDEDDKPAPYSAESLDTLLTLAGAGGVLRDAVLRALSTAVREEERDRRGN